MAETGWIGKTIGGRYQIESLLGQGGMSSVYKGTDPNLRRPVAIKLIHPHLSQDSQFVSRFEEEAAAVARLKHPNIIQVYDFDHDDGTYYMVLEYVPGESLQQRLRRLATANEEMPLAQAVGITASICDALHYAHERDMIHRDIKPANIMINEQGQAVLMDFGVAKIIGGKQHTATGAVVGTPTYISPEQVRGLDLDRRVDIYSLGVTTFEMLSGRPPFEGDSALTTMMMHVNDPVPDLRTLNPNLPSDVIQVVERSLAKERASRYSSAAEMASALRAADLAPAAGRERPSAESSEAPATVPPRPRDVQPPVPASAQPGGSQVLPDSASRSTVDENGSRRGLLAGGAALLIVVACLVVGVGGFFLFNQFNGGVPALAAATETASPTMTPEPSATATVPPPSETPEPTVEPTATEPRGPYVRINGISIADGRYIVDYETFGYIENLPGQHVHFFFNTVPPDQAGVPANGPWYVWGGPRPFNGYSLTDKPAEATQLCVLSANPDHSVVADSGNCVDLPTG